MFSHTYRCRDLLNQVRLREVVPLAVSWAFVAMVLYAVTARNKWRRKSCWNPRDTRAPPYPRGEDRGKDEVPNNHNDVDAVHGPATRASQKSQFHHVDRPRLA